jgi:hypothetical protein
LSKHVVKLVLTLIMVQGLRNSSDIYSLVCKGPGRQANEGAVRSIFVAFLSPELEPLAGVGQRADPRGVEAFGVSHQAHLLRDCVRPSDIVLIEPRKSNAGRPSFCANTSMVVFFCPGSRGNAACPSAISRDHSRRA